MYNNITFWDPFSLIFSAFKQPLQSGPFVKHDNKALNLWGEIMQKRFHFEVMQTGPIIQLS